MMISSTSPHLAHCSKELKRICISATPAIANNQLIQVQHRVPSQVIWTRHDNEVFNPEHFTGMTCPPMTQQAARSEEDRCTLHTLL